MMTKEEALAWADCTATTEHPGDICATVLARTVREQDAEITRLHGDEEVWSAKWAKWCERAEAAEKERDENYSRMHDYSRQYAEMKNERDALLKGEYICKMCGLRKDSDHPKGDF